MEIPGRYDVEQKLATNLDAIFANIRGAAKRQQEPNWQELEDRAAAALEEEQIAVFIVMFLLFRDEWADRLQIGTTLDPTRRAQQWAEDNARRTAQQLMQNIRQELGQDITRVPSRSRADVISASEVTRAGSAGINDVQTELERYGQTKLLRVWITERDARVCPICRPWHGKPETEWRGFYPDGPGPMVHPNCRCEMVLVDAREFEQ